MKRVLFGLTAFSVTMLAAAPELGVVGNDKNVFEGKHQGKIMVNYAIKTVETPVVKYVVFASQTGNYADATDILTLPAFNVGVTTSGAVGTKAGFLSEPTTKVYVKKVNTDGTGVEDLSEGTRLVISMMRGYAENNYTLVGSGSTDSTNVGGISLPPTFFLSKQTFADIQTNVGLTQTSSTGSKLEKDGKGIPIKHISIKSPKKGVVEFSTGEATTTASNNNETTEPITDAVILEKWNKFFENSVNFSTTAGIAIRIL